MKWSLTLWGMATGTSFAVFAFGFVVFFTDPSNATPFEWGLFSLTLFLALAGFCSIFSLFVWRICLGRMRALDHVGESFRQGCLLAMFFVGILFLNRNGWLFWWNTLFLLSFFVLIELYFLRRFLKEKE